MSSNAIPLSALPAHHAGSVSAALSEVAVAFTHLASALTQKAFTPASAKAHPRSAFEEAEELRTYAAEIQSQDPNFAQDLFCAANRHETEAALAASVR